MKTTTMASQSKELLRQKASANRFSSILFAGILALLGVATALSAKAQKYNGKFYNNVDSNGVILNGYDPVAFFTDNTPVKGNTAFSFSYQDATYYFASQQHLDLFKSNPEKYKPQFGAWCAYAVSLGRVAPIDVNTFSFINGRLVIQHNQKAVRGWNEDVTANLKLADKYWPKVTANGGKQIRTEAEIQMIIWISIAVAIVLVLSYWAVRRSRKSRRMAHFINKRPSTAKVKYQNAGYRNKI